MGATPQKRKCVRNANLREIDDKQTNKQTKGSVRTVLTYQYYSLQVFRTVKKPCRHALLNKRRLFFYLGHFQFRPKRKENHSYFLHADKATKRNQRDSTRISGMRKQAFLPYKIDFERILRSSLWFGTSSSLILFQSITAQLHSFPSPHIFVIKF